MARSVEDQLRRFLLATAAVVYAAAAAELWFVGHYDGTLQLIPFGLVVAGAAAVGWAWAAPGRRALLALRAAAVLVVAGSLLGIVLHVRGNLAFEREIQPAAGFGASFWASLHGASPFLAPGMLALAAVLAAAATYRHPALRLPW